MQLWTHTFVNRFKCLKFEIDFFFTQSFVLLTGIFCSLDLIQATNETNVNIPQMADTLFERATNSSWVVVFKALVTTHHLMVHGNEVKLINPCFLFLAGEGD